MALSLHTVLIFLIKIDEETETKVEDSSISLVIKDASNLKEVIQPVKTVDLLENGNPLLLTQEFLHYLEEAQKLKFVVDISD